MNVTIGRLTFDRVRYDGDGDMLYLHRADPKEAVDFDASPEGHALRFNAAGELIGVTLVRAVYWSLALATMATGASRERPAAGGPGCEGPSPPTCVAERQADHRVVIVRWLAADPPARGAGFLAGPGFRG